MVNGKDVAIVDARKVSLDMQDDPALVREVQRGNSAAFGTLMRRYNRRLFRTARAILKDDADAEDALQEAYLAAYRHIGEFRGDARLVDVADADRRQPGAPGDCARRRRDASSCHSTNPDGTPTRWSRPMADPPQPRRTATMRAEMRRLLERRIDALPESYRTVFMLREVEEMTVEETAACLDIPAATVRTPRCFAPGPCCANRSPGHGRRDAGRVRLRRRALRPHRRRRARADLWRADAADPTRLEPERQLGASIQCSPSQE